MFGAVVAALMALQDQPLSGGRRVIPLDPYLPTVEGIEGSCNYTDVEVPRSALVVGCDLVTFSPAAGEDGALLTFIERGQRPPVGFAGLIDANGDLVIKRLHLPNKPVANVSGGRCTFQVAERTITEIICKANIGPKQYLARFRSFAD